jgi:hypothetical protein
MSRQNDSAMELLVYAIGYLATFPYHLLKGYGENAKTVGVGLSVVLVAILVGGLLWVFWQYLKYKNKAAGEAYKRRRRRVKMF